MTLKQHGNKGHRPILQLKIYLELLTSPKLNYGWPFTSLDSTNHGSKTGFSILGWESAVWNTKILLSIHCRWNLWMRNPGIGRADLYLSGRGSAQFKTVLCRSQMHMRERGLALGPKVSDPWWPPGWGSTVKDPAQQNYSVSHVSNLTCLLVPTGNWNRWNWMTCFFNPIYAKCCLVNMSSVWKLLMRNFTIFYSCCIF